MIEKAKTIVIVALLVLTLILTMQKIELRDTLRAVSKLYNNLNADVERQKKEASAKLAELTAQRDMKQAALNKAAADQERKDNDAQAEIARLSGELRDRPVRVRVVTTPAGSGSCSGSAAGNGSATAAAGAGDAAAGYGLLPAENSRRLADAIDEVETLSAAYSSCRARLIPAPR